MANGFKIACVSRLKHGELWKIMKEKGWNQADLARYLGISTTSLGQLINLRWVPRFDRPINARLKNKLEDLTGMLIADLFPRELLSPEFVNAPKTLEQMAELPKQLLYGEATGMLSLPLPPDEILLIKEKLDLLKIGVKELSKRKQLIFDRLCQGCEISEIAVELKITTSAVSAARQEIIQYLWNSLRYGKLKDCYPGLR